MNRTSTEAHRTRLTRRELLQGATTLFLSSAAVASWAGGTELHPDASSERARAKKHLNTAVLYGQRTLPLGIRSRLIDNNNGLVMHILEAGFQEQQRPCVVLLHGFPELAYTWRNQLLPLAQAGFHVIAPDLRGYGITASAPVSFGDSLVPYMVIDRVTDVLGLVRAIGYESVACVVGHDWGGPIAQWCARVRPDVFRSVVNMSTPFTSASGLALDSADRRSRSRQHLGIEQELAKLHPPRKHYWWYSATEKANDDMSHAPQGIPNLLRAMWYFKSADWSGNRPFPLKAWSATELAKMPTYYIMDLHSSMAQIMAEHMPSKQYIAECRWLTQSDLDVYASQYIRTGFQGGLNSYRILLDSRYQGDARCFSRRTIDVPACFIGGAQDWCVRQVPGAYEHMREACAKLESVHLIEGAGHWVAEEQPEQVNDLLLAFLREAHSGSVVG